MSARSPGPWRRWRKGASLIVDANDDSVADVGDFRHQVFEANARLIAAAPELLELLREAFSVMDMQLKRETGDFHVPAETARALWDDVMRRGNALLARIDGEAP